MTDTIKKENLDKIKKELLERKAQIIADLGEIESGDPDGEGKVKFPEYGDKPDENAQEIGEYTTNLAQDKVLKTTLRDIENALERIEKGTYGICKICKKPISEGRLLARPVASTCVDCKTKLQNS
jgi:RNA polymerase-binding protein DksA